MVEPVLLADRIKTSIELGESHFREFKSALEGPPSQKKPRARREIAKDICSTLVGFANADGGTLLVGVEDDGLITGLSHSTDDEAYLRACWKDGVHQKTPLSEVQVGKINEQGKDVLYFYVPKSAAFVHQTSDGRCLQRRDLETVPISVEEIQYTRLERASQEYDRQFVDSAVVNDLDAVSLATLAQQIARGMSNEKCLQYLGLADFATGVLKLRKAALLLFANDVTRWHPRSQIRLLRVSGTQLETGENYNVISEDQVQGNVVEIVENAWDKLRPYLVQTKLSPNAKFESRVMYPEYACREALINAIAHRDYSQEGRGIEIYVFDDRLEVKSPGGLLSTLSIESLKSLTGVHQSRNTFIARALREIGYMREIGEGVRRIYELMKSNELEEPEFTTDGSSFGVKLSNKALYSQQHLIWLDNFSHFSLTREQKAVIVMGYDGRVLSPNDILSGLGIVDTDDFRKIVTNLTDLGILESTMPKNKATRIAQLSGINTRDVPRFRVAVPDPTKPHKRPAKSKKPRKLQEPPKVESVSEDAKLFLGNLPSNLTKIELLNQFRAKGYAVDIHIPRQRRGGRSSYALLQFESEQEASDAMASLNGLVLGDRTLVARKANAKAPPSIAESG